MTICAHCGEGPCPHPDVFVPALGKRGCTGPHAHGVAAPPPALPGTAEFETLLSEFGSAEHSCGFAGCGPNHTARTNEARKKVLDAFHRGQTGLPKLDETDKALEWLDDKVSEGRGVLAFGLNEEGNVGLWHGADADALAHGDTCEDALLEAYRAALSAPQQEGDR